MSTLFLGVCGSWQRRKAYMNSLVEAILTKEVVYFTGDYKPIVLPPGELVLVDLTGQLGTHSGDWFDLAPTEYIVFN